MTDAADLTGVRNLVIVLGDQLDADSPAFDGFDAHHDLVLQMEVVEEATYVRQHKKRIAFFFSAMRHFRLELEARGRRFTTSTSTIRKIPAALRAK
jgi:(6-4)DNA photolyase